MSVGAITNHPSIQPLRLVVESHVLQCPKLDGVAPHTKICPPLWSGVFQIHPRGFYACNPLLLRISQPGTCKHKKPLISQVTFGQMPRMCTFSWALFGKLQPPRNVVDRATSMCVRDGRGTVLWNFTKHLIRSTDHGTGWALSTPPFSQCPNSCLIY